MTFTKHCQHWITGGPGYNAYIFEKLHVIAFEKYIRNARTVRYNLMCYIDAHEK